MLRSFERRLVFPAPRASEADWDPPDLEFEDVYFDAADGTRLHGWYVPHRNPRAVVLYCHGNGEDVPRLAPRLKTLNEFIGVSVFAWDYRSYGRSEGTPHEDNLIRDAHAAHDWLYRRAGVGSEDIVLMGRSLGGAVTVALATERHSRGLVLDRTFSTLVEAAAHNVPWLPVSWIMRNRFASIQRIRKYHGPLFQSHGTADQIVPFHQGQALFEAAPSKEKRFLEVPDLNHNGPLPEYCYEELIEFLDRLTPMRPTDQNHD